MQKTIDKLLPRWLYMVILAVVIFYANYFSNMALIYDALSSAGSGLGFENMKAMPYIMCALIAAAEFGIFELISRIYYNYVLRSTYFKGLTCTKTQFVDTLRVFYIFRCIVLGSATLIVYFLPYFIPLVVILFDMLFSIIFYYLFFLYIKNKHINKEFFGRTFLYLALPFLIYTVIMFIVNVAF